MTSLKEEPTDKAVRSRHVPQSWRRLGVLALFVCVVIAVLVQGAIAVRKTTRPESVFAVYLAAGQAVLDALGAQLRTALVLQPVIAARAPEPSRRTA